LRCGTVGHRWISGRETRPLTSRLSHIDEATIVKKVGRFLHLAYSHGTGAFPSDGMSRNASRYPFPRDVPAPCLLNDSPCHPKCPV
jgi:hypothetical protein